MSSSVLESPFERVKKDHLPIRLLDKGVTHSGYGQQPMRPGEQPLPIIQKPGAIDSGERDRQMLHSLPSPCCCATFTPDRAARASRQRIAAHNFLAGEGLDIRLTASVGVATLPGAAESADELVDAADTAMYQVKQSGKNGIQAATAPADT